MYFAHPLKKILKKSLIHCSVINIHYIQYLLLYKKYQHPHRYFIKNFNFIFQGFCELQLDNQPHQQLPGWGLRGQLQGHDWTVHWLCAWPGTSTLLPVVLIAMCLHCLDIQYWASKCLFTLTICTINYILYFRIHSLTTTQASQWFLSLEMKP